MSQTVVEKIAQAHMAEGPDRPLRAGDFLSVRPARLMTHDNTSAVLSKFKAIGAPRVADPRQMVFCLDHDIQNTAEDNLAKYRKIEAFAREQGIDFYPAGSGIGHQIMCEQGYVTPGSFVVASDSHSNMYGALGALGTRSCAPTPRRCGRPASSGGRCRARSRSSCRGSCRAAPPART
jgi:homoaconitate hydratase